jgi:hypothetical protein
VKTKSQKWKDISEQIQALEETLEAEDKDLDNNQLKEKELLYRKLEYEREIFQQEQKQEKVNLLKKHEEEIDLLEKNQCEKQADFAITQDQENNDLDKRQSDSKSKLHREYNLKMMDLEENLQALMSIPTKKPSPAMECPICLEDMPPPTQIFNCPNGHLVCGECKEKVAKCSICTLPVMGRATAMEQMIRSLYNME